MTDTVNSYLPEAYFLDGKNEPHMRICREELALLDPANGYRVVAGRGIGVHTGEVFAAFEALPRSEHRFLEAATVEHNHILLVGKERAVLIFTDLLTGSGLLLAVSPLFSAAAVCRTLRLLCGNRFAASQPLSVTSSAADEAEAFDALNEILYYLERIFQQPSKIGFWTRTRLLANFVGCPALQSDFPAEPIPLLHAEEQRLLSFLLCTFLTLRTETGIGHAVGTAEKERLTCRVELCAPFEVLTGTAPAYRFLSLPAFRGISLSVTESGWIMEGNFQRVPLYSRLGSASCAPIGLRILLF